ncbi:MAG: AAA family ATPase [Acidimicrobiales bacterium]
MTGRDDVRLAADLALLRVALRMYLTWLRELWSRGDTDVDWLIDAAGSMPTASPADLSAVDTALAAGRRDESGGLARMAATLQLGVGDEVLVAAAWWSEADPQLATVLGCAHDDGSRRYPSAVLLRTVLAPFGIDAPPAVDDAGPLVRLGAVQPGAGSSGAVRLTPTARHFLAGLEPVAMPANGPVPDRLEPLVPRLAHHLATSQAPVVLRGRRGTGRLTLAVAGTRAAGRVPVAATRPTPELRLLARVGTAVPIVEATAAAALGWSDGDGPLLVIGDRIAGTTPLPGAYTVDVSDPTPEERAGHWAATLAEAGFPELQAESLAADLAPRFSFPEADIRGAVYHARGDAAWHGRPLDDELVWAAARRQPEHALARLATVVTPAFTFEDLVLEAGTRRQLDALVAHVALQHVVMDRWGFRRKLPRGQGVAALFTGPPGTGKTMATEALAAELRQDLYRIDLSAVVSKYIGETEKNLAAAFDEAERAGAVLFFDEADSLFGKRTEVRDAHDRYANLEVNYLLQRVESFTGLVVLASNRKAAIDEAFLRRLRFVIRFEVPGRELRSQLWRRSFPTATPVGRLDWDALARPELTGGSIQSIALHAAYHAAAAGEAVGWDHVELALRSEYEKLGKAWPALVASDDRHDVVVAG